ncbi:MAG: alpha-N-acetylglucosaminidase, partial [Prevotellaceae bacterium]|nr:alpha-N-acetylglucosaminidase [Prevotellaceae bacterium]
SGHPSPQWVIQSWQENPRREALDALAPGTLVVLDLFSDGSKKWGGSYAQSGGSKHEFVYCMLHNFGGRTGLHGRLQRTIADFYAAKEQHPLTMLGVGATMEGIETNPVLYEALYELPWRTAELSAADWIAGYAKVRYGKQSDAAAQAWGLLLRSVYDCKTAQQGASESALCARPSLPVRSVSTWSTADIYWDVNDVHNAAALLLGESSRLSGANYEYDVVDVVRQVLSDYGHGLLTRITAAHKAGEAALRDTLAGRFLDIILQQDRLMNTMPDFMVGRWIKDARALGSTGEEKDLYEKNARLLITTWGGESQANAGGLHDYSNRQWGGLLKDFYYPRWTLFFERLKEGKETPSPKEFFDMEYAWATTPTTTSPYPHTAQGNPIAVAKEIFERYCKMIAS